VVLWLGYEVFVARVGGFGSTVRGFLARVGGFGPGSVYGHGLVWACVA